MYRWEIRERRLENGERKVRVLGDGFGIICVSVITSMFEQIREEEDAVPVRVTCCYYGEAL